MYLKNKAALLSKALCKSDLDVLVVSLNNFEKRQF